MTKPCWKLKEILRDGGSLDGESLRHLSPSDFQVIGREALLTDRLDQFQLIIASWPASDWDYTASLAYQVGSLKRDRRYLEAILAPLSNTQLRKIDINLISQYIAMGREDLLPSILRLKFRPTLKRDAAGCVLLAASQGRTSMVKILLAHGATGSEERLRAHNASLPPEDRYDINAAIHLIESAKRELDLTSIQIAPPSAGVRARL